MPQRPTQSPHLIYSPGTQVVSLVPVLGENGKPKHPAGVVGVVLK
ncbi:MAG: nucleotidyltransferase, partial [Planctomyces sp.]|nr:nucleotidyltransferase [Planctomyces sp.]